MDESLVDRLKSQAKRHFRSAKSGLLVLCLTFSCGCFNLILKHTYLFTWAKLESRYPDLQANDIFFPVVFGGFMGQAMIAWLWCGFSKKPLLWRLFIFYVSVSLLLPPYFFEWFLSFELWLPIVIAAYVPMATYRLIGRWELVHIKEQAVGNSRQIRIADMATLAFVSALTVATHMQYRKSIDWDKMFAGLGLEIMWALTIYALAYMSVALAFLFVLMRNPSMLRVGISCGIVVFAMVGEYISLVYDSTPPLHAIGMIAGFSFPFVVIFVASMRCVSRMGYNLVKPPRRDVPKSSEA